MNNNNINKNELDAFSEKVKSKLENHRLPLDADLWNSIQQAVQSKPRRRMPVWLWIPVSSVAVIALVLMLRPVNQTTELSSHSSHNKTLQLKDISTEKSVSEKTTAYVAAATQIVQKFTTIKNTKTLTSESKISTPVSLASTVLSQNVDSTSFVNSVVAQTETKDSIIPDIPMVKLDTLTHRMNSAMLTEKWPYKPDSKKILKTKYKNQWLLAAAFGSGSSASSGLDNVPSATLNDNIVKAGTMYTSIMAPQSFSNVHYSLPLSFGLKVRNKFSERLSIETGLIYTYLQTDFSNSGFSTTDARLGLHYLGIPVNLNVKVWNSPKWEVYVSGGGTVEKGLRSIYQQTQNNTFQTWITTAQTNIDGFQFSVNSAVGLSYKVMPKIGIFFEPQFSYYFENGQPISIRSHQPTVFGLQIGLRYNFKK